MTAGTTWVLCDGGKEWEVIQVSTKHGAVYRWHRRISWRGEPEDDEDDEDDEDGAIFIQNIVPQRNGDFVIYVGWLGQQEITARAVVIPANEVRAVVMADSEVVREWWLDDWRAR